MKFKKIRFLLALVLVISSFAPIVNSASVEVSPTSSEDDGFITGIGAYFGNTPWIFLKEINQDIISGTRFRTVNIPQGSKINNATLFVRTAYDYGAATNLTVTIYGDAVDNSAPFNDSSSFTRPYTSASVNWNVSGVNGAGVHNVSVTNIVQEIIDRIGWVSGNDLSVIIVSAKGNPRREFGSFDGNPAFVARLNITYNVEPPAAQAQAQANTPFNETDYTWIYDETYRGFDIWNVTLTNRTALPKASDVVTWNKLNMTQLTEIDSGAAFTLNNATSMTISALQGQQIASFYNDTGAANIRHFFSRGAIRVSGVTNTQAATDILASITGISTASPVGGNGLAYSVVGDWAGVVMQVNADDERYRFTLRERAGVVDSLSDNSPWFDEADNPWAYFEFRITVVNGVGGLFSYGLWSDAKFNNLIFWDDESMNLAINNFRYPQMMASLDSGTSRINNAEYYTFLKSIDVGVETFVSFPNGTLVDPDPLEEEQDPEDIIDIILGGAQPEDPQEDDYGTALPKFTWKLLVLAVGMIMMVGSPIAGVYYGASTAAWIKILFIMFFGLGILWQIKFM